MPQITDRHLKAALARIEAMNLAEQERICDEIASTQGNLLGSVLVQQQLGNSLEDVQVLLEALIVMYMAVQEAGLALDPVTESQQEDHLERMVATIQSSEKLGHDSVDDSIGQYLHNHDEPLLFAFVLHKLQTAGILNRDAECAKYLTLAGLNLANCVSGALRRR